MPETVRCKPDDWVEVECVLLKPTDRAPNLPPDTAVQSLRMWVKGFAQAAAAVGDELEVVTMTGRHLTGRLSDVEPGYTHTFGSQPPELAHVGRDLRARIGVYRTADTLRASAHHEAGEHR